MPQQNASGTGYKTFNNGVAVSLGDSRPRVGISGNKNKVAAIYRISKSPMDILGLSGITSWADMEITKATFVSQQHTACPTGTYTVVLSASGMSTSSSVNSENELKTNGFYANINPTGTSGAGKNYTWNLTSLFKAVNDSKSFKHNSGTWFIYMYCSSYTGDYQFKKKSEVCPYLILEGRKKGGVGYYNGSTWETCQVKYYVDSTTGWQECEVKYWDGSAWVPVGGP